jgi:hypothetical protein
MSFLRSLLRYLAAPVFLVMAWLTYVLNAKTMSHMADMPGMAMPGMAMPDNGATVLGVHLSACVVSALGSWWLMYLLMGVFALGAWLELPGKRK